MNVDKAIKGAKRLLSYFIPNSEKASPLEELVITSENLQNDKEEKGLIHYASFYRIFGNLMKNISDHGGHSISVSFKHTDGFFHIIVQNKFLKKEENSLGLSIEKSFGLRSIERNCIEQNGRFKFYKKDKLWKSEIWLPFKKVTKLYEKEEKEGA